MCEKISILMSFFFSVGGSAPFVDIQFGGESWRENITPKAAMFLIKSHSWLRFRNPLISWLYEKNCLDDLLPCLPKMDRDLTPKDPEVVRISIQDSCFFFASKIWVVEASTTSTFWGDDCFFPTENLPAKKCGEKSPLQIKWDLMFLHVWKKNRRWDI